MNIIIPKLFPNLFKKVCTQVGLQTIEFILIFCKCPDKRSQWSELNNGKPNASIDANLKKCHLYAFKVTARQILILIHWDPFSEKTRNLETHPPTYPARMGQETRRPWDNEHDWLLHKHQIHG